MAKFQENTKYKTRFISDADSTLVVKVYTVSEKSVAIMVEGEGHSRRCKIHNDGETDFIYPLGRYSMAPIIRANRPA